MTTAARVRRLYDEHADGYDRTIQEPEVRVREAGLQVEQCERSKLGLVLRLAARKPARPVRGPVRLTRRCRGRRG